MAKVLLVEDDQELCEIIQKYLAPEKHLLEIVHDGREGEDRLRFSEYDVAILDLNLPNQSGLSICKNYRNRGGRIPIIMLTSRNSVLDTETGLDCGADDYLTKPFSVRELAARIRALLRRHGGELTGVYCHGKIVVKLAEHQCLKDGKPVQLAPVDLRLLELFFRHPDQIFSADAILKRVWHTESEATIDSVRTAIKRVRQKLDDEDVDYSIIETVPKIGYRLRKDRANPSEKQTAGDG